MNRDALVVGINQYPFLKDTLTSKAKHLNTPASDAEAIALRLEEYGGFRVRRLPESIQEEQRQVDPKKLVQNDALYKAIIQLFNPVGDSVPQTALLYFAGHGLRRHLGGVTEGFLATSDSDLRKNQWGVSLRWLRELLQRSPVQQQMVWLDCCYSGELLNFTEADLGTAAQGRTRFFIAAAREFEPAEENIQGQHGVFSQVLWEGLDPRRQPEGVVNNDRLIEYIDQTLKGTPQQPIWYNPNCEIILTGAREEVFVPTPDGVCPYKGLRFFDVEDAPYFYGREALTQKLIERVQVGKGNFLAVLGVSGSGKSSVLRAGLMYQLQQERRLPGTEQWKIRIFTPGEQPLVSLATAFLDEEVTDIERAGQLKAAEEAIAQGATGLVRLIRASKSPRTVLIVDQFEEVFTVCQSQIDRQQFISGLLDTLKQTGDKLYLIFAMRDDFLGKCAAYRELADLIQANLVMVTPMNAQELRQAIVEPAKKLGRKVEENLIDAILKDLGVEVERQIREPEPGMLPLLSYTLEQLWQQQTLNWLKLDSYNQLGGVQKTLENLAEQAYRQLSVEEQRVADQIFIKLTQLGEGTPDTRKQVPQGDLVTQGQSAELVERVIQKLAQAKLIVTSEQRKGQDNVAVVDVAHESLIRHWWRLRDLLDNNREAIRTERKIQTAAEEWREKERRRDLLLRGLKLEEAKKFLQYGTDVLPVSSLAYEFVEASIRTSNNRRLTIGLLTGLIATILSGTTIYALRNAREASEQTVESLITSSQLFLDSNQELDALVTALEAGQLMKQGNWNRKDIPIDTLITLHQAIYQARERNRLVSHGGRVSSVIFSPDGKILASGGNDGFEGTVKLWSLNGKLLKVISTGKTNVENIRFSPDGKIIAASLLGKKVKFWRINFNPDDRILVSATEDRVNIDWEKGGTTASAENIKDSLSVSCNASEKITASVEQNDIPIRYSNGKIELHSHRNGRIKLFSQESYLIDAFNAHNSLVNGLSCSPDGKFLASGGEDGIVKVWSLKQNKPQQLDGKFLGFSADGNKIISIKGDLIKQEVLIKLWSLDGRLIKSFPSFGDERYDTASISPDGQLLAHISMQDEQIIQIRNINNKLLHIVKDDDNNFRPQVIFSSDSKKFAYSNGKGVIKLWNVEGKLIRTFKGHSRQINKLSFSPDGNILASASDDGTSILWSIDSEKYSILRGHQDFVKDISFSPDGQILASAGSDRTVRFWSRQGTLLRTLQSGSVAWSVTFSPDSQTIVSAHSDKTVKFWNRHSSILYTWKAENRISKISFSPDGSKLILDSGGLDFALWTLSLDDLIKSGCDGLHDYLKNQNNDLSIEDPRRRLCSSFGT